MTLDDVNLSPEQVKGIMDRWRARAIKEPNPLSEEEQDRLDQYDDEEDYPHEAN